MVNVPYSASLNPSGAFSVEVWTTPDAGSGGVICASQDRTSNRAGFSLHANYFISNYGIDIGNDPAAANVARLDSGVAPAAGVPVHLVFTYDGANGALYLNGQLRASAAIPVFVANTVKPLTIGRRYDSAGTAWNGVVDDVAVYSYALTPLQVVKHTLAVMPLRTAIAPATGIVGSSAGNNGQNFGATWAATENDGAKSRSGVMQFNATNSNYISVSGYPNLDSTNGTICFWVRYTTNAGSGSEASMIMDRRDTGGGGSGTIIGINDGANNPVGTIFFQANPSGANPFSSASAINDGLWHHVAVTYGQNVGDYVYIYIDGTPNAANPNAKAWWWPSGMNVLLGKSRDAYWKKLHGSLDDVRFYNKMLTLDEIGQAMTGAVVDANALVLRLDFAAAPAAGYSITTTPVSATVQGSGTVGTGYLPLGSSPYLHIPSSSTEFFRAVVP